MRDARAKRRSEHFPLETAEGTNSPRSAANSFISPGASARLNGVSIHALLGRTPCGKITTLLARVPAVSRRRQAATFPAPAIGILRGAVQPGIAGGRSDDCAGARAALGEVRAILKGHGHPVKVAH